MESQLYQYIVYCGINFLVTLLMQATIHRQYYIQSSPCYESSICNSLPVTHCWLNLISIVPQLFPLELVQWCHQLNEVCFLFTALMVGLLFQPQFTISVTKYVSRKNDYVRFGDMVKLLIYIYTISSKYTRNMWVYPNT